MRTNVLDTLDLPAALGRLSVSQMERLAQEVRERIIDVVSENGGHLAPSLGVVELTIALLSVMQLPRDKIVWDVGHQCYAHKLLTDRRERFRTLRKLNGISGFPRPDESPYDCFATGHASTAISAALGLAQARDLAGEKHKVVAVVGDGSLGGGMAWEAMNNAGASKADLLVILNDNKMSISPSIGAMSAHIARLRTMPIYRTVEDGAELIATRIPVGGGFIKKAGQLFRRGVTNLLSPESGTVFEALGFTYLGPVDGHNLADLLHFITQARSIKGPVLLHVVTLKGKGYQLAENNARRYHGVGPFNTNNGKVSARPRRTYTDVFGSTLIRLARADQRIVAITAAMPDGTGTAAFAKKFPGRFFNVGIAEQHAVTFAAGLARGGLRPVVAIYSTFLQRAYDQIVHDVCLQNLPVVFALDRAGIVGEDGPTHHGVFDLSYLRHIPNLVVMAPKDGPELAEMLLTAVSMDCPTAIRYPREEAVCPRRTAFTRLPVGRAEVLREGRDVAIVAIGSMVAPAVKAAEALDEELIDSAVVNARFAAPVDENAILTAARSCRAMVIAEENVGCGGFAGAVLECLARFDCRGIPVEVVSLPQAFIGHGKSSALRTGYGLSPEGVCEAAKRALRRVESQADEGTDLVIRQSI
jgi:1-deoxy-D-xylulose-5-phosphate synthase